MRAVSIDWMRARLNEPSVRILHCAPVSAMAGTPLSCSASASVATATCSPDASSKIVVAAVRVPGHLPGERDELVGGLPHRGDRHDEMRVRFEIGLHPLGNREDLLAGGHRAATVLLHDNRT